MIETALDAVMVLALFILASSHFIASRRVSRLEDQLLTTRLTLRLHLAGFPVESDAPILRDTDKE